MNYPVAICGVVHLLYASFIGLYQRNTIVGDSLERFERHIHQACWHFASIQNIPAVNDTIDSTVESRFECPFKIGEEIRSAPSTLYSRSEWIIKTEVCVCNEQDSNYTHASILSSSFFLKTDVGLRRSSTALFSETSRRISVVRTRIRS